MSDLLLAYSLVGDETVVIGYLVEDVPHGNRVDQDHRGVEQKVNCSELSLDHQVAVVHALDQVIRNHCFPKQKQHNVRYQVEDEEATDEVDLLKKALVLLALDYVLDKLLRILFSRGWACRHCALFSVFR